MTNITRLIRCCGCETKVEARLTDGREIYPHRPDLHAQPFWKCDRCGNYVGCHWKTKNPTEPLGNIPTPELRNARKHIHAILDPLWQSKRYGRKELYGMISDHMGFGYHTAQIRTVEEARKVWVFVRELGRK
ncbi:zinc-finger-containing protein [Zavarzinella formosa]|uniref:zinc-finger-containing protein n=1 Tax=Zavarzinella formosa TaxID=360055 RepID=UPI00036EDD77|nr:zinc-finger-containing protein [Zavarzinella formosa]